jgi:FtsH-binding integral membrane protein
VLFQVFVTASFIGIFLPYSSGFHFIVALGSAFLFSAYIVYDTQQILKRASPEEYILASVELYLDIINLFLSVLRILNSRD